jgi:hypothetical protein
VAANHSDCSLGLERIDSVPGGELPSRGRRLVV